MIRFLIEQGYKDREAQGVASEALGIIYDAKKDDLNLEPKKDDNTQQDNNNGQSSKEDEDTN